MKNTMIALLVLLLPACLCAQQTQQKPQHLLKALDKHIENQMNIVLRRAATEELLSFLKTSEAKQTQILRKHVRRLVQQEGADVNGQDDDGNRVFTLALLTGDADTVKYLVNKGISFSNLACEGIGGDYLTALAKKPLCKAGKAQPMPVLYGSDVELAKFFRSRREAASRPSMAALSAAVAAGNWPLAQYYANWFGVDIADSNKRTALHVAAENNDEDGVKFLLENGANPAALDLRGHAPSDLASEEAVKKLLSDNRDAWRQDFPLHRAVRKNDVETARRLVAAGADVNEGLSSDNRTPLIDAARFNQKAAVQFLLEQKADLNKASDNGWTPLHWVVSQGSLSMLKTLVEAGADMNVQDAQGNTPLYYAVKRDRHAMADYLQKKGANADIKNKDGVSAAQLLAEKAAAAAEEQYLAELYK